jgi:hypothetical protein
LCARPLDFYEFYSNCREGRWFYEVIQDGYPVRPYFDLEFKKACNQSLDPMTCFHDFISICKETFDETLNIRLNDSNFMILDSTTDEKFSAHVIIHLPDKMLFPSNVSIFNYFCINNNKIQLDLKPLISMICEKMRSKQQCVVKKEDGREEFLCDQSVYSKNRNFRMYYSSKYGKKTKLLYASYCKFYSEFNFIHWLILLTSVINFQMTSHRKSRFSLTH